MRNDEPVGAAGYDLVRRRGQYLVRSAADDRIVGTYRSVDAPRPQAKSRTPGTPFGPSELGGKRTLGTFGPTPAFGC
jgi:hypothetical protein